MTQVMSKLIAPLCFVLACGGSSATEDVEPAPVESPVVQTGDETPAQAPEPAPIWSDEVAALVVAQEMFAGWTVVPFAAIEHEGKIVVAVWPSISPDGEVVDDDIAGITLQRGENGLQVTEEIWMCRGEEFTRRLGTDPAPGSRGEGVPAEMLAELLQELPRLFAQQVRAGERDAAVETAISFSRLFDFETAVEQDTVAELLGGHLHGAQIEAESADAPGRVRAHFSMNGRVAEEEILIATEVSPGLWTFTDHQRVSAGTM